MREKLKEIEGERKSFRATFERYGTKKGYASYEPTVLLKDIIDIESGECLSDHQWFKLTKGFLKLGILQKDTVLTLDARVRPYEKGYKGYNWEKAISAPIESDLQLSHPTKITCAIPEQQPKEYFQENLKPYQICNQIKWLNKERDVKVASK